MLTVEKRKAYFEALGIGAYSESNIRKFQRTAFTRSKDIDGKYGIDTDRALRHWYNVNKYTKNFRPEEFRCECGGKYCSGYPSYMKKVELQNLQSIRDHFGKPMTVTCGLRCKPYNASLRGSITNSKHLTGYATDFYMLGVTDTLTNRKKAIKWIKKLPNHNYTYGNGIDSSGVKYNAPYMGNALHTDTKKPVTKTVKKSNGQKIADAATRLSYPTNTSKANYGTGKPREGFLAALNLAYPHRGWTRVCSCDIHVGVCVRSAGVDKNFPRGLSRSYLEKSDKFKEVHVTEDTIKDGDIIITKGDKHICIHVGGKIKEASLGRKWKKNGKTYYSGFYGKTTNTLKSRLKGAHVYRAK